jgi:hypothetical protein
MLQMESVMALRVTINWQFEPADYFEAPYKSTFDEVPIEIEDGKIVAELEASNYEADPGIRDRLRSHVEGLFEGVKVLSHRDYRIGLGSVEKNRPDGGRDISIAVEPARAVATAGSPDIKVTDAEGNVVTDTRQKRIAAKKEYAELIASRRGSDQTLDAMLESYSNAVRDPDDELVHLFEIREALVARFRSEGSARQTLGLSSRKWSTLGRLANDEPLNQGRHRGRQAPHLRDASPEELEDARSIAREMIVLYIKQLG